MSQTVILRWGTEVVYKCPGCDGLHSVPVEGAKKWEWNGDLVKPTISPSVKHTWTFGDETNPKCCHYFIKEGRIEFCADCTHDKSGQTLPLEPFSEED